MGITVAAAILEGVLSFFSPCILPLLPVYFSILGMGADGKNKRSDLVWNGLCFCLGLSVIFISLGAAASALGRFLSAHLGLFCKIAGALAVLMGVITICYDRIPFLMRERRMEVHRGPGKVTAFLMGMAFAFGWVPCISAPLAGILLLASASATVGRGIGLLICYSLGFCVPFLLCAAFAQVLVRRVKGLQRYARWIRLLSGGLMVVMGILLFTGSLNVLAL